MNETRATSAGTVATSIGRMSKKRNAVLERSSSVSLRQQLARARPGEREADALGRDRPHRHAAVRQVVLEPAQVEALGDAGADDHEAVRAKPRDREVAHQLAGARQHRREARPAPAPAGGPPSIRFSQASARLPVISYLP